MWALHIVGAVALFRGWRTRWRLALITNLVALGGVSLGIVALAIGAGPEAARGHRSCFRVLP